MNHHLSRFLTTCRETSASGGLEEASEGEGGGGGAQKEGGRIESQRTRGEKEEGNTLFYVKKTVYYMKTMYMFFIRNL